MKDTNRKGNEMSKTKIDIPSGNIAGKLCNGYTMVQWGGFQTFTLRRCYRNGEPSGGAVINLRINRDQSVTGAKNRQVRIRKGWNEKTIAYAVFRLMRWVKENERLWIERQKLYNLVEDYDIPENVILPKGRNSDYQIMSLGDISYWSEYIPNNFSMVEDKHDKLKHMSMADQEQAL